MNWLESTVWMPSFVAHEPWENKLLDDEETIVEMLKDNSLLKKNQGQPKYPLHHTFVETLDEFGETLYQLFGEFKFQSEFYKTSNFTTTYKPVTED